MKTLTFSVETNMMEMAQYVRVKAKELYREAIANEMEVTGPVYWVYTGADGNPHTKFRLDICIPVFTNKEYEGDFKLVGMPAFKCVSTIHAGSWYDMGQVYQHLFSVLFSEKHVPSGVTREIYQNMDFENPENNLTEIQVGVL